MAGRPTVVPAFPILGAVFYIKEPGYQVRDGNLSNEISHMNTLRYVIVEQTIMSVFGSIRLCEPGALFSLRVEIDHLPKFMCKMQNLWCK